MFGCLVFSWELTLDDMAKSTANLHRARRMAILLALWRFAVLFAMSSSVSSQLKTKQPNTGNPLGRVLQVASENPNLDPESLELKLHEAVLKERPFFQDCFMQF